MTVSEPRVRIPARWWLRNIRAITLPPFGIWIRSEVYASDVGQAVLQHEYVHWEQYLRIGGSVRFYVVYIGMWVWYGNRKHPMEIEARERSGVR